MEPATGCRERRSLLWDPFHVARNPLNYFEPYESLPPHHESQLTARHRSGRRRGARGSEGDLAEAGGIEARQDRRPSVHLPGATGVERAYLELGDDEVQLNLWPADTLSQARTLYTRPNAIEGLRRLHAGSWRLHAVEVALKDSRVMARSAARRSCAATISSACEDARGKRLSAPWPDGDGAQLDEMRAIIAMLTDIRVRYPRSSSAWPCVRCER